MSQKSNKNILYTGNGGTKKIAENVNIDIKDFKNIKDFLKNEKIDLTVIGPEEPLVNGLVDFLKKYEIKVFEINFVHN